MRGEWHRFSGLCMVTYVMCVIQSRHPITAEPLKYWLLRVVRLHARSNEIKSHAIDQCAMRLKRETGK